MMRKIVLPFVCIILLLGAAYVRDLSSQPSENIRLLVFTKTDGFRHASIPEGIQAVKKIGVEHGYAVDQTEDATLFNEENLASYDAVVFLNTTGDVLNEKQQNALKEFITGGGGFVGIHSATDTEYEWPWYNKLIGAYFEGHPRVQEATIRVINREHSSTRHLPEEWVRTDEWYNFKNIRDHIIVLAYLDESTYEGGTHEGNHPIAWYHDSLGGRVFYTAGGHTRASFSEPAFRKHLAGGIQYVLGEDKSAE